MTSGFVPMAGTTMIAATVIVILAVAIYQLYRYILEKQRRKALEYLLAMTKLYYFYGYSVAECLQAGVAEELYIRDIGDFTKQMGALVLCALSNAGAANDPEMYCGWYKEPESGGEGHNDVTLIFPYKGKRWRFDVLRKANIENLSCMQSGYSIIEENYEYGEHPNFGLDDNCEYLRYWWLRRSERHTLEKCANPKTSDLQPSAKYVVAESELGYRDLVHRKVKEVMDAWYFQNESQEEKNLYLAED